MALVQVRHSLIKRGRQWRSSYGSVGPWLGPLLCGPRPHAPPDGGLGTFIILSQQRQRHLRVLVQRPNFVCWKSWPFCIQGCPAVPRYAPSIRRLSLCGSFFRRLDPLDRLLSCLFCHTLVCPVSYAYTSRLRPLTGRRLIPCLAFAFLCPAPIVPRRRTPTLASPAVPKKTTHECLSYSPTSRSCYPPCSPTPPSSKHLSICHSFIFPSQRSGRTRPRPRSESIILRIRLAFSKYSCSFSYGSPHRMTVHLWPTPSPKPTGGSCADPQSDQLRLIKRRSQLMISRSRMTQRGHVNIRHSLSLHRRPIISSISSNSESNFLTMSRNSLLEAAKTFVVRRQYRQGFLRPCHSPSLTVGGLA